mgnify:CR=1 FL=1
MTKTTNSAGFQIDTRKPNTVYSYGEAFPAPDLPDWENLPDDLIDAMNEAHVNASYAYGDEGNGYNPHLMLAYLLESDAYKRYTRIPTPKNPLLHDSRLRKALRSAEGREAKSQVLREWETEIGRDTFLSLADRTFAGRVVYRLLRIVVNDARRAYGMDKSGDWK